MRIALALPRTLRCLFVVAVPRLPCPVESVVPWRVGPPYRRAATSAFGTPWLSVTHHRFPWTPGDLALTDDERHLLRRTRQHVVVTSTAAPRTLPASAQVARAAARALAQAGDGLVIDPLTGTTVPLCGHCPDEPSAFRPADDWLGWDVRISSARDVRVPSVRDVRLPSRPSVRGLRVTSRGLRRFAFPEITLDGAACSHTLCATSLLSAVADRLLTGHLAFLAAHPHATTRLIDDHLVIDSPGPYRSPGTSPSPLPGGAPSLQIRLTPCDEHPPPPSAGARTRRLRPVGAGPAPITRLRADPLPGTGPITRLRVDPLPGTGQVACLKVGPAAGSPTGLGPGREPSRRPAVPVARHPRAPSRARAA
ncbi:hypothetical protein ACGF0J_03255 [Nonomuraea sp. NPDC047897]|uniref:hypothetical protein n=1 Tax=Nonomuraea sp. NPDC047897 TaxID=3364346 RepID=UPI00371A5C75